MKAKRNIFFTLCALFVFISANSLLQLSYSTSLSETSSVVATHETNNDADQNQSITSIKEFTGFIVKGNENTHSGFQNFQNNKKQFTTNLTVVSSRTFTVFYSNYCQYRINSIHDAPFYIAYHRLII